MLDPIEVPVLRLDADLALPTYAHPGDAGADLRAAERCTIAAGGGRATVRTGLAIAIPDGWAGFVLPRSGLARNHGVTCLNTPGLVDAGYRGELMVVLVNTDPTTPYTVERGDRIAQLVLQPVAAVTFTPVDTLPDSVRGENRFGSSGV